MEDVLGGFQQSLGNLSSEIRQLQSQSYVMSVQLKNRRLAEAQLADFLKHTAVPPTMVNEITGKGDAGSEAFAAQLRSLHGKLEFVKGDPRAERAAALGDVEPELEKLRVKAVSRVREYLMQKFHTLRKPKTNFQIIQQNVLRKHIDLIRFLQEHGGEVFEEVHASYVDTMSKVYMAHFHNYTAALMRLLKKTAGPQTLLAGEEHRGAFSGLLTNVGRGSPSMAGTVATDNSNAPEAYRIGTRGKILEELEAPPRIPHVAEAKKDKLPYEEVFRCMQKLLMETSTSEFVFCTDFFGETKTYSKVFAGAISVVEENITTAMPSLHDPMTLLLVIRVNSAHQKVMLDRSLHCLDTHFDRVAMLAWPRLKAVFDAHLSSLRQAQGSTLATKHTGPHLISKRFAELAKSMFLLNRKSEDAQIDHSMDRISGVRLYRWKPGAGQRLPAEDDRVLRGAAENQHRRGGGGHPRGALCGTLVVREKSREVEQGGEFGRDKDRGGRGPAPPGRLFQGLEAVDRCCVPGSGFDIPGTHGIHGIEVGVHAVPVVLHQVPGDAEAGSSQHPGAGQESSDDPNDHVRNQAVQPGPRLIPIVRLRWWTFRGAGGINKWPVLPSGRPLHRVLVQHPGLPRDDVLRNGRA
eukprot:scaffold598_cov318-Pavlova_lutheri.AAC.19